MSPLAGHRRRGQQRRHPRIATDLAGWTPIINETGDTGAYETPLMVFLPLTLRSAR